MTLILEGRAGAIVLPENTLEDSVKELLTQGMSVSDISRKVSKEFPSVGRRKIYNIAMDMQKSIS
eukprot:scaffold91793_cov38-Prasinocladus_malaysianus.AAC.3